jgi:integrase
MITHNGNNERIKRRYLSYLKEARRHSVATVDAVAKALARFEADTKYRDFKLFRQEQAVAFKRHLAEQRGQRSGEALSKATLNATAAHLKRFFQWLAMQRGYRSRVQYTDAEYFNLSDKDVRVATARRERAGPTLEQAKHVIGLMPAGTDVQRRDRAVIAFTLLTGARDSAIASMKLKHVDIVAGRVEQDAREVRTKNSKTFTTYFLPVGDEIHLIVEEWVRFLREHLLWGNDDPLFPATRVVVGAERRFEVAGLDRAHWSTAARIRAIFRDAFAKAGLPYCNPHSFRKTVTRLGQQLCKTPEDLKAWSQNLGHEKVLTTLLSYGYVEPSRQGEIIRGLGGQSTAPTTDAAEIARAVVRELREAEIRTRGNGV